MRELRISEVAELLGVSSDTVRRLADSGTLRSVRTRGRHRCVDGRSVAQYLAQRCTRRDASSQQSIRNHLPGIVLRVLKDKVAAQVELQAGRHRLVALVTREAVDALGLRPGMPAVATVKATNLAVELPRTTRGRRHVE
jgi:molybdopterin-binding protein